MNFFYFGKVCNQLCGFDSQLINDWSIKTNWVCLQWLASSQDSRVLACIIYTVYANNLVVFLIGYLSRLVLNRVLGKSASISRVCHPMTLDRSANNRHCQADKVQKIQRSSKFSGWQFQGKSSRRTRCAVFWLARVTPETASERSSIHQAVKRSDKKSIGWRNGQNQSHQNLRDFFVKARS